MYSQFTVNIAPVDQLLFYSVYAIRIYRRTSQAILVVQSTESEMSPIVSYHNKYLTAIVVRTILLLFIYLTNGHDRYWTGDTCDAWCWYVHRLFVPMGYRLTSKICRLRNWSVYLLVDASTY
jgi:hypothetical protein